MRLLFRLLQVIAVIAAAACGGGGGNSGGQTPSSRSSVDVTLLPAGHTIDVVDASHELDGLRVVVPAGAVAAPTRVTIERLSALPAPALPAEQYRLKLSPDGTRFASPLEISVPLRWQAAPTAFVAYQTVDTAENWTQVADASWDPITGRATAKVAHFSGFVFLPRVPTLPLPPSGVYRFSIFSSIVPSPLAFTPDEAAAIRETILTGTLQPFYACAGGFAFTEVPWPASGNPTADIVIAKRDIPGVPQLSSFIWTEGFTRALLTVRSVDIDTGAPILLYAGTGAVPASAYDLRTVTAHELSHFMSIPSQGASYDPDGLFFGFLPKGVRRGLNATDKLALVARFPRCAVPVVALAATPAQVPIDRDITVTWSVTNYAESCTASGDWSGTQPASGTFVASSGVTVVRKRFTLACVGPVGTGSASASVLVTPASCPQLAGTWTVTGTAIRTCDGSLAGQSFRNDPAGSSVSLYQSACALSELPSFPESGTYTIADRAISVPVAPMFYATNFLPLEAVFTQNQITTSGMVATTLARIDWTSTGGATGTIGGVPGSCSFASGITFTR